jgi:hypothetical protein
MHACYSSLPRAAAVGEIEDETERENEASRLAARRHAEALLKSGMRAEVGAADR